LWESSEAGLLFGNRCDVIGLIVVCDSLNLLARSGVKNMQNPYMAGTPQRVLWEHLRRLTIDAGALRAEIGVLTERAHETEALMHNFGQALNTLGGQGDPEPDPGLPDGYIGEMVP
jgi:hypothetical protein